MEELLASVMELAAEIKAQRRIIEEIKEWSEDIHELLSNVSMEVTLGGASFTAAEFDDRLDSIEEKLDSSTLVLESTARTVEATAQSLATLAPIESVTAY